MYLCMYLGNNVHKSNFSRNQLLRLHKMEP